MKTYSVAFTVLAGFLLLAPPASAQTLGIRLAAGRTAYKIKNDAYREAFVGNKEDFSAGIYYERPLWKRLGFSTGLNYLQFRNMAFTGHETGIGGESETRHLLEVPLYLHLQVAPAQQKAWSLQLLGGYSYGRILSIVQKDNSFRLHSSSVPVFHPDYHFFNAGFECSYRFRNRQTVSLGLQQRLGWRPYGGGYFEKSRDYCIVLKTGLRYGAGKNVRP